MQLYILKTLPTYENVFVEITDNLWKDKAQKCNNYGKNGILNINNSIEGFKGENGCAHEH